ncbi:type II secretion system F family protein [Sphingomicrobium sp. XHP0239]|uniref:type II secretion system F family protein n=1 Tax=Sphingomicrobium maritimum TaxID=3133972 RepID=UPI0031CC4B6C
MIDYFSANEFARYAILAMIFFAVVLVIMLAGSRIGQRQSVRARIRPAEIARSGKTAATLRADRAQGRWVRLVNSIEKSGLSLVDTKDATLRRRLLEAGYTSPAAPRVYTLIRFVLVLALPALVVTWMWAVGGIDQLVKLYVGGVIAALFGLYVPSLLVTIRADRRREEMQNGFPDALDLMLVCVEAGLGLEAAFNRVGMEMATSHPLLAEQFAAVTLEMRAGRSREDALRRMADRAGVDDIRAFATLLIQSTKLGSSIAATLRTYAAEMREKRKLRAEERAHRVPVLLSMPLVGCMLPAMIGVLMIPAVIRVVRNLLPALG